MMGRRDRDQASLFYDFNLDDVIPENHLLRRIDVFVTMVRGLGPLLSNVAHIGVALLWVTGLILVWSKWDGFASLPQLFWVKAIFILSLTAVAIFVHLTYAEIRKGNVAAASRLPKLGPIGGVSAILAVLFAVLTFN